MPELPEVETIRRYFTTHLIGKTISAITIFEPKQFIGDKKSIIHTRIVDLQRIGKVLIMRLSNDLYLNVHLKMSGQLLINPPQVKNNYIRVKITFSDETVLVFRDFRKFGWIKITKIPENSTLIDVLSSSFTLPYLYKILKTTKPIKVLLLDQSKLAGIGNIYACDALFEAKIDPAKRSSTLSVSEVKKLYESILLVINEGIKYRGSSASQNYRLPDSTKGSYQDHFRVYKRDGLPCIQCTTTIKRIVQGGRSTFYCPTCQE